MNLYNIIRNQKQLSNTDTKYRHEFKYLISDAQCELLKVKLNGILKKDSNVGESGKYLISSLYFDSPSNKCYYENENGTDPREKFRIRIYNHDKSRIRLECKRKENGKTLKLSCPLTLKQAETLISGKYLPDINEQHPVLRKLSLEMMIYGVRPVVIVEYERIPFVYANGNVRITLDTNISSSQRVKEFLHGSTSLRPIMPVGQKLLEVKYDEYLPDFIYHSIQTERLRQTAFSKYYLCRRYSGV